MEFKWKQIYSQEEMVDCPVITTWRARVIGGWVISQQIKAGDHLGHSMVFVPDKDHSWTIERE